MVIMHSDELDQEADVLSPRYPRRSIACVDGEKNRFKGMALLTLSSCAKIVR